jgi:ankyrin repeat protein
MATPGDDPALAQLRSAISSFSPSSSSTFPITQIRNVPTLFFLAHTGQVELFSLMQKTHNFCGLPPHAMNSPDQKAPGCTPLWAALCNGHVAIASLLMADPRVFLPTMYDPIIAPHPLIICAQNGHAHCVKLIIDYATQNKLPNVFLNDTLPTVDEPTALFKAAQNGRKDVVPILITAGVDVNKHTTSDFATPLSMAAYYGFEEIVDALLACPDINVNGHADAMMPPLAAALKGGHVSIVGKLLTRPQVSTNFQTATGLNILHFLGLSKRPSQVISSMTTLILPHVTSQQLYAASDSMPTLLLAKNGHADALSMLFERCPPPPTTAAAANPLNSTTSLKDGSLTALFMAVESSNAALTNLLLSRGADPKIARKPDGMTCLHLAALSNDPILCKALLKHGADVNATAQWMRSGATGKPGWITARSIANQLDNLCAPVLMDASKRRQGAFHILDVDESKLPDWAREEHEKKKQEAHVEIQGILEKIKQDPELAEIMTRPGARDIAEKLFRNARTLETPDESFEEEFSADPELRGLFDAVLPKLKTLFFTVGPNKDEDQRDRGSETGGATKETCASCGKTGGVGSMKACGACKKEHYCGRDCQANAWKAHRRVCKGKQ